MDIVFFFNKKDVLKTKISAKTQNSNILDIKIIFFKKNYFLSFILIYFLYRKIHFLVQLIIIIIVTMHIGINY